MRVGRNIAEATLASGVVGVEALADKFGQDIFEPRWHVIVVVPVRWVRKVPFLAQVDCRVVIFAVARVFTDGFHANLLALGTHLGRVCRLVLAAGKICDFELVPAPSYTYQN